MIHAMVAWELGDDGEDVAASIFSVRGYHYITPLPGVYVVQFPTIAEYEAFVERARRIGTSRHRRILISPPMQGGHYRGVVGGHLWTELDEVTGE